MADLFAHTRLVLGPKHKLERMVQHKHQTSDTTKLAKKGISLTKKLKRCMLEHPRHPPVFLSYQTEQYKLYRLALN